MAKPWSWKAKLTIAFVAGFLALLVFVFMPSGQDWMRDKIKDAYNGLPVEQRRESSWSGWWLALAYWRGGICGELNASYDMYKEFCGLTPQPNGASVFTDGKLRGLCSADGKTGWGPLHPDAPDAYYNYLALYEPTVSAAWSAREAVVYYNLFYDWHMKHSPEKKPHPKFMKNWLKVQKMILDGRIGLPAGFDLMAKKAAPWVEP